jgi:hypothetical protein
LVFCRYNAQKRYTEAADLLYTGALTLLNAGQVIVLIIRVNFAFLCQQIPQLSDMLLNID